MPEPKGAFLGKWGHFQDKHGKDEARDRVAQETARTVPGRENGGNCDIETYLVDRPYYFPFFVDGANLSTGGMHLSQGDGEGSFCGAIEMSGFLDRMKMLPVVGPSPLSVNPIFENRPWPPFQSRYSEWLVFEGVSVDEKGVQHCLNATIVYKRAVLNYIKYLAQFGYTEEQVYLMLSCIALKAVSV